MWRPALREEATLTYVFAFFFVGISVPFHMLPSPFSLLITYRFYLPQHLFENIEL